MGTDKELLERARTGDRAAVDEILSRHERQIFRYGLRMCGNEEDARDVLQETLLAAFQNMTGFRGDAQLSTWLYQIARNFCARSRRRTQGEPERVERLDKPEAAAVPSGQEQPDAMAHAREMGSLLHAAILTLPPAPREALILRDIEGLSAEEAAQVVGIEIGALKSRLHRARLELREKLIETLGPSEPLGDPPLHPQPADEIPPAVREAVRSALLGARSEA